MSEHPDNYHDLVRREIAPLLPPHAPRVLEVGCGSGATLAWLKQQQLAGTTAGIELSASAAQRAHQQVDQVWCGDIDTLLQESLPADFDLILCLDVLEHLPDPWHTLQQLRQHLRPHGRLLASLPNLRHHSVVLPLLLAGQWRYADAGILDRTHLRFFTLSGMHELLDSSGFTPLRTLPTWRWGRPGLIDRCLDRVSFGYGRGLLAFQYLLLAEPTPSA